ALLEIPKLDCSVKMHVGVPRGLSTGSTSVLWSLGMTVSAPRRWALALAGWSAFVWVNRLRNLQADPDVAPLDEAVSLVLSGVSLVFVVVTLALALRARVRGWPALDAVERGTFLVFAAWTIAVWLLRVVDIVV